MNSGSPDRDGEAVLRPEANDSHAGPTVVGVHRSLSTETTPESVSAQNPAPVLRSSPISTPRLRLVVPRSPRLPKFTRAKPSWRPVLALQERDRVLLRTAAEYRLVTTPQFLLLFSEESRDAIYSRLQKLFHHGYLDRLGSNPNTPMLYALGRRGAEVLGASYRREPGDGYIAHQLMIGNFRIALTLAVRATGIVFEWRRLEANMPVRPDGFFALTFPDLPQGRNRAFFLLEADRSTMTRERFVRKVEAYQAWYEIGGHTAKLGIRNFRVLTITKSDARSEGLIGAIRSRVPQHELPRFWFSSGSGCKLGDPGDALGRIWEVPGQLGVRKSLVPRV